MIYKLPFNSPKLINRWAMYDWANSAFALVITSAVFPTFFTNVSHKVAGVAKEAREAYVTILGFSVESNALYSYALSLAFLTIMILSPLLSGIADAEGLKKRMMRIFCYIGSFACFALLFFDSNHYWIGVLGIIIGMIGYNGSVIYYNAFIPLITTEENFDRVSARGYAFGYLGSVILLVVNLLMISKPEWFGLSRFENPVTLACQISFAMVGLWWLGFAQITFNALPVEQRSAGRRQNYFKAGMGKLKIAWNSLRHLPHMRRFLYGFFFCAMSLQTILYIATLFAKDVIQLKDSETIIMVLLLQFVGTAGAILFSKLSARIGNVRAICIAVFIWICVCIAAYMVVNKTPFFIVASIVGFVMGALQSLNRSTFSKLIPVREDELSSFYSFLDVTEKAAITIGTLSTGLVVSLTGSLRNAILIYSVCFVIALYFYARVKIEKVVAG
jgi:UMF1 family MFS transporter